MRLRDVVAAACVAAGLICAGGDKNSDLLPAMETYAPKSCKFNVLPNALSSRAYAAYTGEIRVHDVFGIPSTIKRHVVKLEVPTPGLLTVQAEVHRDTPTTLTLDAYNNGQVGSASGRVLNGKNLLGAGGEDTKAFLHGQVGDKEKEISLVFELISVEIAASQVDARVAETKCWPIRLDLTLIPLQRAPLYWPLKCPQQNNLPPPLQPGSSGNQVVVLTDTPLVMNSLDGKHFSFRFGDERPWVDFGRALWSGIVEVPPRLHRFVRLFFRTTFHFASGPLQIVIELFDLKDMPDGTALAPKCAMGCLGGVPVFNGQVVDHAMPTGFRYRIWLLAAYLTGWTAAIPDWNRHCIEFDFDYSIAFEQRMTPFEVGPTAWLCEYSRLPGKIVQLEGALITDKLAGTSEVVSGRSIWVRDRFGFPPDEVENMEHEIAIEVSEPCVFRATTHHSDGVDVFIALKKASTGEAGFVPRACQTYKHPGPVPRQSIFCVLQPGSYSLIFFADYPLGGLHPCSDFFAQFALRPIALANADNNKQCLRAATDLTSLTVARSTQLATAPKWKGIRVPIGFDAAPTTSLVWSQDVTVTEQEVGERLYLRLVLHSDYVSSDLRFQVKYEGRYVADTQVTSHGYADMIGPLDSGTYTVEMYYVNGVGPTDMKLCSVSMVDLRLVSRSNYDNRTSQWLCTSTRVPPPELFSPQPDEQVLIDSEYVIPETGTHYIMLKLAEPRLIRIATKSAHAEFELELWPQSFSGMIASGDGNLEALVGSGTYQLKLKSSTRGVGSGSECSVFMLNLLLVPKGALPLCPWASGSSDHSAVAEAQRQAGDHIGSMLLDLVPKHLTQDVVVKQPVTLWMNQGMEKSFDLEVDDTAAIRLDVSMQPPFLPLEVVVRKKRASGKLEAPIATAEWTESRLLLLQSELPSGTYSVEFRQPRKYKVADGRETDLLDLCSHVTVSAEVGVASKEAVNSMRAELLDLPDLLAVQPFPPSLNTVGWFASSMVPVVGTQVYKLTNDGSSTLKVDEKVVMRMVCEPADLSNAAIQAQVMSGGQLIATSDSLGQLVTELLPGTYEVKLRPKMPAPFLVTVALATETRLREDFALAYSGHPCLDAVPDIASGMSFAPSGWTIGPVVVRLSNQFLKREGVLSKTLVQLRAASILYIEVGSGLPLDLVRIGVQVPEGLWIGEQRGVRGSLEIELPAGRYTVHLSQPKPLTSGDTISRCLDFSVFISAKPLNPTATEDMVGIFGSTGAAAAMAGTPQELAPREEAAVEAAPCFAMGTNPLPLDLSDKDGGSTVLGGPLGKDGRLIIRTQAMLTDMHDGRKKIYLSTGGKKLQLKVGVTLGKALSLASQLSFSVQKVGGPQVASTESWTQVDGWERIFVLDGGDGYWLAFHHGLRERSESACLHFGLMLEIHPVEDMPNMIRCAQNVKSPQEMFPNDLSIPSYSKEIFRFVNKLAMVRQEQIGFLQKVKFTLNTESFVSAEVGFNFYASHAEMDIVKASDVTTSFAISTAEVDWIHSASSPTNALLTLHKTLPPGDYVLRIADDHYKDQLGGSQACFPFSFEFRSVPAGAPPTVVSVQPHPSVPLVRGVDLVMTIRFSEPPRGSLDEVVSQISLGGVQAFIGGSMNQMSSTWASKKRGSVQASTSENHKVWVIAWSADTLTGADSAKLSLGDIRSNVSGQPFKFNHAFFFMKDVPPGRPWTGNGGLKADDDGDEGSSGWSSRSRSSSFSGFGKPVAEGSATPPPTSSVGSVGAPVPEVPTGSIRGASPSSAMQRPPMSAMGRVIEDDDDDDDVDGRPQVEEWNPMDDDGGSSHRRRSSVKSSSDATAASSDTGDTSATGAEPAGSRAVYAGSAVAVMVFGVLYYNPQLRTIGSAGRKDPSGRFRDIGERRSEEEVGLVQYTGRAFHDDDDML